jgi:hypothetical protein
MLFSCYGSKFEFNAADRIALKPHASGDWSLPISGFFPFSLSLFARRGWIADGSGGSGGVCFEIFPSN